MSISEIVLNVGTVRISGVFGKICFRRGGLAGMESVLILSGK